MPVPLLFLLIIVFAIIGTILFVVGLDPKRWGGMFMVGLLSLLISFLLFLWLNTANNCKPYPPIEVGVYPVQTINDVDVIIFTDIYTTPRIVNLNTALGRTFKDGDKIHVTRLSQELYEGVSYSAGRGPYYTYEVFKPSDHTLTESN